MTSNWEKVIDKATVITLGHKLTICVRSVGGRKTFISLLRIVGLVFLKVWIMTAIGVIILKYVRN